ncbi:hypothetical protein [Arthrobacter cryoconiti]|uniref:Uncharacterized protein n=1 Tax=Arthrobacter cryoconiti TaxID=748907 RepID=A0ABV8QYR0_9MICC|nr:hypothetical protein [Arthrobacter cryoconiti]MCC9067653.1 hypothetical protein [Arthrobacter cryoconiti]
MALPAIAERAVSVSQSGVRRGFRTQARLCAAVAIISVAAHLWMAWEHRLMPWESAAMVLMAAICLPCAIGVWRDGSERGVRWLFLMALVMVAWHTAVVLAPVSMAGHGHGGMPNMDMAMPVTVPGTGAGAMLAIIALELAVAALAAGSLRRVRINASADAGA